MAKIKSAIKRVEVTKKKTLRNKSVKSEMQTAIKKYKALVMSNKPEEAEKALPGVIGIIDSSAAKGVIHKNAAARRVSSLSKLLSDLKSGKLVITAKIDNKERARAKAAAAAAEKERIKAEAAAKNEAKSKKEKKEKPAKEDRKRKKAAEETEEVRVEKEEKPVKEKKEKKAKKVKDEE